MYIMMKYCHEAMIRTYYRTVVLLLLRNGRESHIGVARGEPGGLGPPQREWKKFCTTVLPVQRGQIYM